MNIMIKKGGFMTIITFTIIKTGHRITCYQQSVCETIFKQLKKDNIKFSVSWK